MKRHAAPQTPSRLVGETYLFRPGARRVVVVDHETAPRTGRTGRLIVTPAGDPAGRPFAASPEDLE